MSNVKRYEMLDVLRGVAALAIVLYHIIIQEKRV
jgi:peptidoglycan/LPS O-acetylase OafA/YrhL